MNGVNYLNIEYFVLLIYRLVTGTNVDASQIPGNVLTFLESITWIGVLGAIIFLLLLIYTHMRLHGIIHEGWHHRDNEMQALKNKHLLALGKNPKWEHVMMLMGTGDASNWRRAIIEADIMLDELLRDRGYVGQTLGDKLKSANPIQFPTLDLAWTAHRVRNDIAHGGESFLLEEREAKGTIDLYKRVFVDFDYI